MMILVFGTRHPYMQISGVNIDHDIEEKFDIGTISGGQGGVNLNIVCDIECFYSISHVFFDIELFFPISM